MDGDQQRKKIKTTQENYQQEVQNNKMNNLYLTFIRTFKDDIDPFLKAISKTSITFVKDNIIYILLNNEQFANRANETYALELSNDISKSCNNKFKVFFVTQDHLLQFPEYAKIIKTKKKFFWALIGFVVLIIIAVVGASISAFLASGS